MKFWSPPPPNKSPVPLFGNKYTILESCHANAYTEINCRIKQENEKHLIFNVYFTL